MRSKYQEGFIIKMRNMLTGETCEFKTQVEAATYTKVHQSNISAMLHDRIKQCNGWTAEWTKINK